MNSSKVVYTLQLSRKNVGKGDPAGSKPFGSWLSGPGQGPGLPSQPGGSGRGRPHSTSLILGGLDRASRPIAPDPPLYSALRNRRTAYCQPGLSYAAPRFQFTSLNGADGICRLLIRRGQGSARGDYQGENRGPMVQDVPSARSRSGGFLTEGSA